MRVRCHARGWKFWLFCALPLLLAQGWRTAPGARPASAAPESREAASADAACARCHQAIYDSYEQTPMRRASGPAPEGLMPGGFLHAPSGIRYTLFLRNGEAWLSYDRPNPPPGRYLKGEQRLRYFIGSGTRGRTYLFNQQGWWFESPVNWYSKKAVWDMAPNYLSAREMPFTLPVDPNCLHCHASEVAPSLPGSRNRFAGAPFSEGGITCAACHGDGAEHVRTAGRAALVNPAKLPATQRDSICLQCHLEGEISVYKPGRSLAQFHPGASLFESVTYFVHKGEIGPGGRATSQWEALLESKCKQASGERLTCTTCHDPHRSMAAETQAVRVEYYRGKCLECHTAAKFRPGARPGHHPEQPDCAACHMPRRPTQDIAHEQVTDHRIQIPNAAGGAAAEARPSAELVAISGERATDRDLGLAYAQLAQHGDRVSGQAALELLRKAETMDAAPDPELHTELGFLDQMSGDAKAAEREYRAALSLQPEDSTAAGDLGVLLARGGDYGAAVPLWREAFAEDPGRTAAGFNLAVGECVLGDGAAASATLARVLVFSPDNGRARELAAAIASGRQKCGR